MRKKCQRYAASRIIEILNRMRQIERTTGQELTHDMVVEYRALIVKLQKLI